MARVFVGTPGPCCHQGLSGCLWSGPQPVTMLVSEGCAAAGARPIWVVRVFNWICVINQIRAVAEDHVWGVALPHPGSVLMSVTPETIKDCVDAGGLGCHLGPCLCLRVLLLWGLCWSRWPALSPGTMVTFGLRLLPRTVSGSMVLPQLGSLIDVRDLSCH